VYEGIEYTNVCFLDTVHDTEARLEPGLWLPAQAAFSFSSYLLPAYESSLVFIIYSNGVECLIYGVSRGSLYKPLDKGTAP